MKKKHEERVEEEAQEFSEKVKKATKKIEDVKKKIKAAFGKKKEAKGIFLIKKNLLFGQFRKGAPFL